MSKSININLPLYLKTLTLLMLAITASPQASFSLPTGYQVLVPSQVKPFTFSQDRPGSRSSVPATELEFAPFLTQDKATILHLWSTACPSCIKELPALDQFAAHHRDKPFHVIALSVDDPRAVSLYHFFLQGNILHLKPYHRPSLGYPKIKGLPTTFFFDRNGDLVGKVEGPMDWSDPSILRLLDRLATAKKKQPENSFLQKITSWISSL